MKKRKLLALLLSAAMLMTMTVPAHAEGAPEPESDDAAVVLPYGFKGMPAGYVPDREEAALKSGARAELSAISRMTPGVDYLDKEIVYFADSEDEARTIAEAYNAELFKYQYGVATAYLKGDTTVAQAMEVGASLSYKMPLVSANYITKLEEPEEYSVPENAADDLDMPESDGSEARTSRMDWIESMENPDPALDPRYVFYKKSAADPEGEGVRQSGYQWIHDYVGTYDAWNVTMGSRDIVVAVIDTGVNDQHEDLKGHAQNLDDVIDCSSMIGIVDDNGKPVLKDGKVDLLDDNGHGTHVAGIIAASAGNGVGGAGIAPGVSVIGIPIFYEYNGECTTNLELILAALKYVAGYNKDGTKEKKVRANIVNLSLGGLGYSSNGQKVINELYERGVTVCAAMGNSCSNIMVYPAAYDHVIAVCATSRDNMRVVFSNYGSWADISAPGYDIFSTWNGHEQIGDTFYTEDHDDWYVRYNGTSMAAPIVSGACALYMSAVGPVDPDTMEAVLKKNATKLSEKEMGAGLVNVAAMMPDTATLAGVDKPMLSKRDYETNEITAIGDSATFRVNDEIILDVPEGAAAKEIVVTFDGKDPTYKNGKAGKNCYVYRVNSSDILTDKNVPDKFTLKAAYVSLKGTLGRTVSVNVTLDRGSAEPTTYISCTGPFYVAAGKTVQYTGEVSSDVYIADNGIEWSVQDAPAGVTINKNGKLKVGNKVSKGTKFFVRATAKADSKVYRELQVKVISPITGVKVEFEKDSLNEAVNAPVKDKKGNYKSVRMYTVDLSKTKDLQENVLKLDPVLTGFDPDEIMDLSITSSDPEVVDAVSSYLVAGGKPGKAKVTIAAKDGSGKKATFEVNVIVPASSFSISSANNQNVLTYGNSLQIYSVPGCAYGTPTVTEVNWDYQVRTCFANEQGDMIYEDLTQTFKDNKLITIDKKGKVTANKKSQAVVQAVPAEKTVKGVKYYKIYTAITVEAATTDGTNYVLPLTFLLTKPTTGMYILWPECSEFAVNYSNVFYVEFPIRDDGYAVRGVTVSFNILANGIFDFRSISSYLFSSSNPICGWVSYTGYDEWTGAGKFEVYISKPGYAKITITANDGSGKKMDLHIVSYGWKTN